MHTIAWELHTLPDLNRMRTGPGFLPTFLYYFSGTTLIATLILARGVSIEGHSPFPTQLGLLVGVVGGLIGAAVNRTATLEIALAGKRQFASTLRQTLTDLGYVEIPPRENQATNLTIYARPRLAGLFSGKIFVQLDPQTATIASRAHTLRRLRDRL